VPVRRRHPHIQLASQDAIRHFAHGVGDPNPLWTDPAYTATPSVEVTAATVFAIPIPC
jgi:acyl dehydratase